ncbi:MAG: hypothetical protein C5S40_04405 [ANME-2 cluster archaeon]|nr:hypothetical protein [ANME-2 cluster archaeon]
MSEKFFNVIINMLNERQLSISSISRQLKSEGYDQHRLIITGYLRALNDTGYLVEQEIPPSKVYSYNHRGRETDIYRILENSLKDVDPEYRYPVAVYILTSLLNRPCFRYELSLVGITPKSSPYVRESRNERLKEFREDISRFDVPETDKAYEMIGNDKGVILHSSDVINGIMKNLLDLTGLKSRSQQSTLKYDQ